MTDPKSAWLAAGLLAAISVVALAISLLLGPAAVDTAPAQKAVEQKAAETEPVDGAPANPANGLELLARAVVNPDPAAAQASAPPPEAEQRPEPPPALRGAELPPRAAEPAAEAAPAAPVAVIAGQPWNDARADIKSTGAAPPISTGAAPPIRKPRDSRAEPHGKRAKAAASNRACAPSNSFAGWLRKLNLGPRCTS